MFIGWLTCIPAALLPHSLCRFTTANAPANRQMPIASVVSKHNKKKRRRMKFPFEVTKIYRLANNEFDKFTTPEIIENVFKRLTKENFVSICRNDNEIELKGDKDKIKFLMSWHNNYRIVNFIDSGKICILDSENERKLIYTFKIKSFLIHEVISVFTYPILFYIISKLMDIDIPIIWTFSIFLIGAIVLFLFYVTLHLSTINAPLEIMKNDNLKNRKN
jgi:hypothetical protein